MTDALRDTILGRPWMPPDPEPVGHYPTTATAHNRCMLLREAFITVGVATIYWRRLA